MVAAPILRDYCLLFAAVVLIVSRWLRGVAFVATPGCAVGSREWLLIG
ncbi:hypothetical protein [Microbacterium sp. YY-01]